MSVQSRRPGRLAACRLPQAPVGRTSSGHGKHIEIALYDCMV
jgi:crotonobetainyl-CoA:carnitine CoA-transferase CaiB-like acyl-CoA transferase